MEAAREREWESAQWLPGLPDRARANCGWQLVLPVFTIADSVDSALPSESTMLTLRQPAECTRGVHNGKMKARARSHEIDGCVIEGSDAALLPLLDGAIGSCHRLMRQSDGNRITRGGCQSSVPSSRRRRCKLMQAFTGGVISLEPHLH